MLQFYKYQGAGNDFIIIDDSLLQFDHTNQSFIASLCDRHFGIGADGVILFRPATQANHAFTMVYFNADGSESTMCGNGGRCIAQFALDQSKVKGNAAVFNAIDGIHLFEKSAENRIRLKMIDVTNVEKLANGAYVLNTGSPHYVQFAENISTLDVKAEGKRIRNSDPFKAKGINVNFAELTDSGLDIRTYERGVEDETLACGTGITAAAIAAFYANKIDAPTVAIKALGGDLNVQFLATNATFEDVWLEGPANFVFQGII